MMRLASSSISNNLRISVLSIISIISSIEFQAQEVDYLTGNLKYEQELMKIPTTNGFPVRTYATYQPTTGVTTPASALGLGWQLMQGSRIDRIVNMEPDDRGGFISNIGQGSTGDIEFKTTEGVHRFVDFARDQYIISGSEFSGELVPYLFEYEDIPLDMSTGEVDLSSIDSDNFRFILRGSFHGEMEHEDYPESTAPVSSTTEVVAPGSNDYSGDEVYDSKPVTANYVEYFTNAEIITMKASPTAFFIESSFSAKRLMQSSTDNYSEAIGAFRITDESGFVYHYSLPSYLNYTTSGAYPLDESLNPTITDNSQLSREDNMGDYTLTDIESGRVVETRREGHYALTWYLTAITGPEYEDLNKNHQVDNDDFGFWVKYNYVMTYNDFIFRQPRIGYEAAYVGKDEENDFSGYVGMFTSTNRQAYLLKSIETRDYEMLNIWDTRKDEFSQMDLAAYNDQIPFKGNIAEQPGEHAMPYNSGGNPPTDFSNSLSGTLTDNNQGANGTYLSPVGNVCRFLIDPPGANQVHLKFDRFDVAAEINKSTNMEFDPLRWDEHCSLNNFGACKYWYNADALCTAQYLKFYDGTTTSAPEIPTKEGLKSYCGGVGDAKVPKVISSSVSGTGEAAILVEMYTMFSSVAGHESFTGEGFDATWHTDGEYLFKQESWRGRLFDDGGETGTYAPGKDYTYVIQPLDADGVSLSFNSLNLGSGDHIKIYQGDQATGTPVTLTSSNNSSSGPAGPYTSGSHDALTLVFHSDGSGNGDGFDLEWFATWIYPPLVKPDFKLTKILLMHKKDKQSTWKPVTLIGQVPEANFDYQTLVGKTGEFYSWNWYQTYKSQINPRIISGVEFDQDYSLCKKYIGNNEVFVPNATKLDDAEYISSNATTYTNSESGKLTLNKLRFIGNGGIQTMPSFVFDYLADNSSKNPDYDLRKKDNDGFYKSDGEKGYYGYRSYASSTVIDAWALREIESPLGEVTQITYESDRASKKLTNESGTTENLRRYYHIADVTENTSYPGTKWTIFLDEESSTLASDVTNSSNDVYWFIPFSDGSYDYHSFGTSTSITTTSNDDEYEISGLSVFNDVGFVESSFSTTGLSYRGGGYVMIELPDDEEHKLGDLRVTKIKRQGVGGETYETVYEYGDGYLASESRAYGDPIQKVLGSFTKNYFLETPKNEFDLPSGVFYETCKVTNKGQSGAHNGWKEYEHLITESGSKFRNVYVQPGASTTSDTVVEYINDFRNRFGNRISEREYDRLGNMLSELATDYTYSDDHLMEVNSFLETYTAPCGGGGICTTYVRKIHINRDYENVVNTTTYTHLNKQVVTTTGSRNPINGKPTSLTKKTGDHLEIETKAWAFENSLFDSMGPKCLDPSNSNQLTKLETEHSANRISSLSGSSHFDQSKAKSYSNDIVVRKIDIAACAFDNMEEELSCMIQVSSHVWDGDLGYNGQFDPTSFESYDHGTTSQNEWRSMNESKLFDEYDNTLSWTDKNGVVNSQRTMFNGRFHYMALSHSNFESATACGFEEFRIGGHQLVEQAGSGGYSFLEEGEGLCQVKFFEGEIKVTGEFKRLQLAHTGKYSLNLLTTAKAQYLAPIDESGSITTAESGRRYKASVWVQNSSPGNSRLIVTVTGTLSSSPYSQSYQVLKSSGSNISINGWTQMNIEFDVPDGVTSGAGEGIKVVLDIQGGSGAAIFDDLRLFPIESTDLVVNVFDEKTGLKSATLDINNFATVYEYYPDGQIKNVKKEVEGHGLVKVSQNERFYWRGLNN
ncbi:MAG: CUB domain-containing protein [Flavobacteriales bacterium]